MAIGSFLKRLFGAPPASPAAPLEVGPSPRAGVEAARRTAEALDRRRDRLDWAMAQQMLGSELIAYADGLDGPAALAGLSEAGDVLDDALAVLTESDHPAFRASLANLRGLALSRAADRLDGDDKGHALAEAANAFTTVWELVTPETSRARWVEAGFYRGAAFQGLALLKGGGEGLGWLDEAAHCYDAVAGRGLEDGRIHPVAAYNRYVVLEERARRTPGNAALPYYAEAHRSLEAAMADPELGPSLPDLPERLAALDAAMRGGTGGS